MLLIFWLLLLLLLLFTNDRSILIPYLKEKTIALQFKHLPQAFYYYYYYRF